MTGSLRTADAFVGAKTAFKTIYIEWQDRHGGRSATLEAEFFHLHYAEGRAMITIACPLCMKGAAADVDIDPSASDVPRDSIALTIRQEKKPFTVSRDGKLSVEVPITCAYCGQWSVRIKDGIAYNAS